MSREESTKMDITVLVKKQHAFFRQGHTLSEAFRQEALGKLDAEIHRREKGILQALHQDLGKSDMEANLTEIGLVRGEIRHVQRHLSGWIKGKRMKTALQLFPARCYQVPEPYGVVLIMSPWNYPFMLTLEPLIGALAAGNCVTIKTSAYAPQTAKIVHQLIGACFPPEYCTVVQGSREENQQLLRQRFDYIFFTGSVEVGRRVMEAAARHLTPVTLELGGKSPVIVDESAKVDLAAKRLVFAKYINAGQTCVAPDYVLVHESQKQALIQGLDKYIRAFYPKEASGKIQDYPHIVNEKHFERLCGLMENEKVIIGGKTDKQSLFIEPTVLDGVSWEAPVMGEEIFGPLLPILSYTSIETAIERIQDRPKPLALYLFSEDRALWHRIERSVSFGGGCINDALLHVASSHLPFGGVGESGMGQYHGQASFDTFSHYKSLVNKSTRLDMEMRYRPYTAGKRRLLWR